MDAEAARRNADALAALDEITRRLRRECPWDREQDARSIVPHTVEEAYELADAAHSGDDAKLLDELGDVLFQVHFLALLLEERDAGSLGAVADNIREKLIRRHPHVFAETEVTGSGEVLANWDRIKREQEGRAGLFDDVPENLPALLWARKIQRRVASRAGADSERGPVGDDDPGQTIARVRQSVERLDGAAPRDARERAVGETLFLLVDLSRRLEVDPELALRAAASEYRSQLDP